MRRSFSARPPLCDFLDSTSGDPACMCMRRLLDTNDHPSKHSHSRCVKRSVAGCRRLGINSYDPHGWPRYCQPNSQSRYDNLHNNDDRHHLDFDCDIGGPESGCSIREDAESEQLDTSITDSNEASERCQTSCSQKPECSFVFAQQLFPDYGQARPHFQCYFIDHHFNETMDLQCGQSERIWGEACGFDAEGRGQPVEQVSNSKSSWWKW